MRQLLESFVFDAVEDGWDALPTFIDAGLVSDLRALNDDPSPILAALTGSPRTLVHSDYRPANLGVRTSDDGSITVILVDWGRALFGAPTIDLGYYLGWTALERATDVDHCATWQPEAVIAPAEIMMGTRLRHRTKGTGTVLAVRPSGKGTELLIRFDATGEAWIVFGYGVLEFQQ